MAGYRDVVDDDLEPHFATDPDDWAVDVVDLLRGSLDNQCELWHLTPPPGLQIEQQMGHPASPEKALPRRRLPSGSPEAGRSTWT